MRTVLIALISVVLLGTNVMLAQGPPPPPISVKELVEILKSKQHGPQAAAIVEQRGVNFELNPEIEKQLRKAKATDAVIEAVKKGSPASRTERAAATGGSIATDAEQRDMLAIQNELNPDAGIQLAVEFEQKYPKSPLLTYVLALSAAQYEQKGDVANVIAQSEKSLALKSDNLMTLLVLAHTLPQQQSIRTGNPEQKLDQAEKYATQALELIGGLSGQANESPEAFASRKASYMQEMHSALGMVHFQRAMQSLGDPDKEELTKAEAEFDTSVTITGQPTASDYYRLGEVRGHLKKYDAAIEAYTRCVELDRGGAIKPYADQAIASLQKRKGLAPAKP